MNFPGFMPGFFLYKKIVTATCTGELYPKIYDIFSVTGTCASDLSQKSLYNRYKGVSIPVIKKR